jgi:uncharacterized membrane protein YqjE
LDLGFIVGLIMLVIWAVFVFVLNNAPGFVHLLLTLGLFIVIWRIVARVKLPSSTKRPQ